MGTLDLVAFAGLSGQMTDLITGLSSHLGVAVRQRRSWFELELAWDPRRGQHNSLILLRNLLADPDPSAQTILGVVDVDLFSPVLTFVYGEAQLDGRAAVVSLHRLRPESYGLPENPVLLSSRLLKEAIHEVGHTWGLVHCFAPACVMRSSTYVDEIDLKPVDFCAQCCGELGARRG